MALPTPVLLLTLTLSAQRVRSWYLTFTLPQAYILSFSDSFWFSAVEGEVYAMSSFFTAITFWCIMKWEREANQPHASRWLVLIAYLIGLSVGVHLLSLLTIPAMEIGRAHV